MRLLILSVVAACKVVDPQKDNGGDQQDGDRNTIRISLSIWAAQLYSEAALLQVNQGGTFFETEILDMFDTCRQFSPQQRRRTQQEEASSPSSATNPLPAVVSAWHKTAVMLRVSDELLWSTWTFTFPVLRVGQLYIEEAMTNHQGISITDVGDAAVKALAIGAGREHDGRSDGRDLAPNGGRAHIVRFAGVARNDHVSIGGRGLRGKLSVPSPFHLPHARVWSFGKW